MLATALRLLRHLGFDSTTTFFEHGNVTLEETIMTPSIRCQTHILDNSMRFDQETLRIILTLYVLDRNSVWCHLNATTTFDQRTWRFRFENIIKVAMVVEPNISFEFVSIPIRHPSTTTYAHPCPPMNNNIAPMPTQNPWAWVGISMGTQCRALHGSQLVEIIQVVERKRKRMENSIGHCWGQECILKSPRITRACITLLVSFDNVLWDWQYYAKKTPIPILIGGIFCIILLVPHNLGVDMNNIMWECRW